MLAVLLTTACSQADVLRFTPPAERPVADGTSWPANRYAVLAYHDVEDGAADQRYMSVRTSALNEQFAWLKQNGYQPVSVEQILQAQNGGPALPNKAVLLTFDDGYRSFYSRVFPLLKAYNWPAVLAPVGVWLDAPAGKPVDFGGLMTPRDRFLTWQQVREVSDSGWWRSARTPTRRITAASPTRRAIPNRRSPIGCMTPNGAATKARRNIANASRRTWR